MKLLEAATSAAVERRGASAPVMLARWGWPGALLLLASRSNICAANDLWEQRRTDVDDHGEQGGLRPHGEIPEALPDSSGRPMIRIFVCLVQYNKVLRNSIGVAPWPESDEEPTRFPSLEEPPTGEQKALPESPASTTSEKDVLDIAASAVVSSAISAISASAAAIFGVVLAELEKVHHGLGFHNGSHASVVTGGHLGHGTVYEAHSDPSQPLSSTVVQGATQKVSNREPGKSKLVLLLIEVSFCGFLGFDRMYADQLTSGLLKFVGALTLFAIAVHGRSCFQRLGHCLDNAAIIVAALIVWDIMDYFAVLQACLARDQEIDMLGFRVRFEDGPAESQTAFLFAVIHVVTILLGTPGLIIVIWCYGGRQRASSSSRGLTPETLTEADIEDLKKNRHVAKALNHSRNDECGSEQPEPCPICLDTIAKGQSMQTLPCFHNLHHTCAVLHFRKSGEHALCPVCRIKVGPSP